MNKLSLIIFLACSLISKGFAQASCSESPALHFALFDASGPTDPALLLPRMQALGGSGTTGALLQMAQQQNLDALCLNGVRDRDLQNLVLSGFTNDPTWNVYQPAPLPQPGCRNACTDKQFNAYGTTLPLNRWVEFCSFTEIPGTNYSCSDLSNDLQVQGCMAQFCPFLSPELTAVNNASCQYCMADDVAGESDKQRILRCTYTYNTTDAGKCRFGNNGEAGGILVSRYPFVATEYHEFTEPLSTLQPGLVNWGITYGKIQTPMGPVHLFCSSHATAQSGMNDGAAQPLNANQSLEVLNYIQSKANGQVAIYFGDTGSGPAVASSSTGPANAQWLSNFGLLQSSLSDALLDNVDPNANPIPAAACTYGCTANNPSSGYVDHIMTSGSSIPGYTGDLCHNNGQTLFTSNLVPIGNNQFTPLSDHFGVYTEVSEPAFDVSSSVKVTQSGFTSNRATGIWTATMTVTNTGGTAILAPIQVVFSNLTAGVTMTNNTGLHHNIPYLTLLAAGSLAPGSSISVPIHFTNPNKAFISYTPRTYVGIF